MATQITISVVAPSANSQVYSISVPGPAVSGGLVNINWTAPAGHSATDYLALFPTGTYSRVWLQYTGAALNGSFAVPLNVPVGSYDVRYYVNDGGTVATQITISVVAPSANSQVYSISVPGPAVSGGLVNINWTAPAGHSATDYLALFPTGMSSRVWLQYTGTALNGSFAVPLDVPVGSYDVRYYLNDGGTVVAQTTIVVVAPSTD